MSSVDSAAAIWSQSSSRRTLLAPIRISSAALALEANHPADSHRDALAAVMLDSYRNTIDDEGEDLDDAYSAIDHYLERILRPHSFVVLDGGTIVAFSFVLIVNGVHYIDPIVVAADRKRHGLGRATTLLCLQSLATAGVAEVGATITDGNVASERLFMGLGFSRHGTWP